MLFVSNPPALGLQLLPGGYGGQRSQHGYRVAVPSDFYPEHTEAVFVVVESDTFDQARDFLSDGLAFKNCGIQVFIWLGSSLSHGFQCYPFLFGTPLCSSPRN